MSLVYWDTMVFAYILEANPVYGPQARAIYESIVRRGDKLCTSVFTVGELLVQPRMRGDQQAVTAILGFFRSGEVELIPYTMRSADQYGHVRSQSRLKAADAIHIATAIEEGVNVFVTNDKEILRLTMPGVPFIVGLDGNLFRAPKDVP